jgi:RNA polymerase sigma-70 factor (ECF subfamily)
MNFRVLIGQGRVVDPGFSDAHAIGASLGERDAFVTVFERHFDAIYGYLSRRVDVDAASELASEVFVVAFANRDRYDLTRPDAGPWLYGIATNVLRRRHRSDTRRREAYNRIRPDRRESDDLSERVDPILWAALGDLAPVDLETLLLFVWADLGYEQIAEALEIPVGTVRSRINRARRQLRAALAAGGISTGEAVHG